MNKKIIITIIISIITIIFIGMYLYIHPRNPFSDSNFICAYPKYASIMNGQNKEAVTKNMGRTNEKIIKLDANEYRFGQGDTENKIKEGWIYTFNGWDGHIEIYFDKDEIVIGKNCGNG